VTRALWVHPCSERYVLLRGVGLSRWLREHDVPAVRSPIDRGYKLRKERLPDVLAMAHEEKIPVHVREVAA